VCFKRKGWGSPEKDSPSPVHTPKELSQFAENVFPEVLNGAFVVRLLGVSTKLDVKPFPREPFGSFPLAVK
jgi:hypothetical protein